MVCRTNGRSVVARRIDWQVAELWRVMESPADWRNGVAHIASHPYDGRAYLDIDSGLIGGITPTPGFGALLEHALERAESSRVVILTSPETRENASRLGMVETGERAC